MKGDDWSNLVVKDKVKTQKIKEVMGYKVAILIPLHVTDMVNADELLIVYFFVLENQVWLRYEQGKN